MDQVISLTLSLLWEMCPDPLGNKGSPGWVQVSKEVIPPGYLPKEQPVVMQKCLEQLVLVEIQQEKKNAVLQLHRIVQ